MAISARSDSKLASLGRLSPKTIAEIQRYLLYQVQMHDSPLDVFYRIIQLPTFTSEGDTHMATLAEWIANTTPEMLEQQWLQEGRQEGQALLIQRMFTNGMSLESIATATGYPVEEIQKQLSFNNY